MKNGDLQRFSPTGLPANYTCATAIPAGNSADKFILCDKSASTNGIPFPNNVIPDAKKSPNGIALTKLWPRANAGSNRFFGTANIRRDVRQEIFRDGFTSLAIK